jgi:hypothetical protein
VVASDVHSAGVLGGGNVFLANSAQMADRIAGGSDRCDQQASGASGQSFV